MNSKFFEIDCGYDEPVVMERREDGEIIFHGWDLETELAAQELGFQPSAVFFVWDAARNDRLDEELFERARNGEAAIVELLLAAGAGVDAKDKKGWTALQYATLEGYAAVVELLLTAGADVSAKDKDGRTVLQYAAVYGKSAIVELLLAAGADVNAKDKSGRTALYYANRLGHDTVVELIETWKGR